MYPLIVCILGMAAVTALTRVFPILWLSQKSLPKAVNIWLSFIPVTVLSALVAPEILLTNGSLNLNSPMVYATIPTILFGYLTQNFLGTVLVGMVSIASLRYFIF